MNPILQAMEAVRQETLGERIELTLCDASEVSIEIIVRNGGRVESSVWHDTCQTHGCSHMWHPGGYEETVVAVPPVWQEGLPSEIEITKLFKGVRDTDRLLLVIPDKETGPRAVVKRTNEHPWYPEVRALHARDELVSGTLTPAA